HPYLGGTPWQVSFYTTRRDATQPGAGTAHRSGSPDTAGAPTDPSGPSLPVTGDRLVPIVGTGAAALIGGVGLLLAGRRRTR
ncbi:MULTISPECIES: LPXTG cell wall anchor domain-containing protein, partial [unclassified Micromonospora]|uniref:LPXTG cell wall anchor domain-containing protein n=1 Tax=unclassified Micromonospora TaxID=2617518 RepID=UPI002FF04A98